MSDEHSPAGRLQQKQPDNDKMANQVSEDDPHKIEKLARGDENTDAVD